MIQQEQKAGNSYNLNGAAVQEVVAVIFLRIFCRYIEMYSRTDCLLFIFRCLMKKGLTPLQALFVCLWTHILIYLSIDVWLCSHSYCRRLVIRNICMFVLLFVWRHWLHHLLYQRLQRNLTGRYRVSI